jgi:hypothetical protein
MRTNGMISGIVDFEYQTADRKVTGTRSLIEARRRVGQGLGYKAKREKQYHALMHRQKE